MRLGDCLLPNHLARFVEEQALPSAPLPSFQNPEVLNRCELLVMTPQG